MSTLVTGACGFLGCNLVEHLLSFGRTVLAVDLGPNWPPDALERFETLPGRLSFRAADVSDAQSLAEAFATPADLPHQERVDGVIHAAAITPGPEREARDADKVAEVNLLGTLRVLTAARDHGVRRFVYPSSASVYGEAAFPSRDLEESLDAPLPDAIYGISKYAAERSVLRARRLWSMDVVAARVGAAFGPWEHDTGLRDTFSGPMLSTRALLRGERVVLAREGPRDWVYSLDVAAALVTLLDAPVLEHDVYHVSAGRRWSLADWCRALAARLEGASFELDPDASRATIALGSRERTPLAIGRLIELYEPRFGLEEAIEHYLGWLQERSPAWHALW